MSPSNLKLIRDALDAYAEQMKIDIKDNPFAEEVKACDSPGAILQLLEKNRDEFKEYRDRNRNFIDCLDPVVKFVHRFSGILDEATSPVLLQPAKLIFVGINVLFTAADGVSASYDALLELFERIGSFLKRLEIYANLSLSPPMMELIVKIMLELLSILAQTKNLIKQGRLKKFAKKLFRDNEIESMLRRLDRLTEEEARMMQLHILEAVYALRNSLELVMDGGEGLIVAIRKTLGPHKFKSRL
ncbi:hypothetical protein EI94DRAFT_1812235 [Lactarius quietus]|nr:hypothetical protein EI94DRAFT_1813006 [Lactarius quietus]KAF8260055.1 hypothetical protein EI94DRAFT_1812235 [Lactarius quietus]